METTDPNSNIWETHLPPLVDENDKDNDDNQLLIKSLHTLAEVVKVLGISDASYTSYSTAITHLSMESFSLDRSLNRLEQVEEELVNHLASLKHEYHLIQHWNKTLIPGPSNTSNMETAATLERRREMLIKKAKEYHKELELLLVEEPLQVSTTVSQLLEQKEKNQARERELKEKRAKIKAFQGLPANLELARHELRAARQKQMELIQLRERLLNRMADGVS